MGTKRMHVWPIVAGALWMLAQSAQGATGVDYAEALRQSRASNDAVIGARLDAQARQLQAEAAHRRKSRAPRSDMLRPYFPKPLP
jgi:hypothetical protein